MQKKILIFHPFLAPYRIDVYNRLAQLFKLKVVCWYKNINPSEIGFNLDYVNSLAKFDYDYVGGGLVIKNRVINFNFAGIIKKFRPDIVLPHEFGFNTLIVILLIRLFRYKVYLTCDDSPKMAAECSGLRLRLRNYCIKKIDGLIAVNPQTISILRERYPDVKCRYFYFPIIQSDDVLRKKLETALPASAHFFNEYNLKGKKVLLFVGRLEDEKGVDLLIESYSKINTGNEYVLVIVGGGSKEEILKKRAATLKPGCIIFTGKLSGDALYAWYNLAHVFVLPSRFEPFGAVVNEALVAGCSVVVSNVVGASCLVDVANGAIFNTEDVKGLMDSLEAALNNVKVKDEVALKESKMLINFNDFTEKLISFIEF